MFKVIGVVISYNIGQSIVETINSLKMQIDKIIIVDNGSEKKNLNALLELVNTNDNIELIINEINLGIAKATNIGIEKANTYDPDFILTLDHDSIAKENMVSSMLEIYEKVKENKNVGILAPAIYDLNLKEYIVNISDEDCTIVKHCIQSGSLISRKVFEKVGYFVEDLFIYYVDTDFSYRVRKRGYEIIQCNKALLYHEEGKKSRHKFLGKEYSYDNYSNFAIYYRARNYIYMIKNHFDMFRGKKVVAVDAMKILLFDKNRFSKLRSHFKGLFDGIRDFLIK